MGKVVCLGDNCVDYYDQTGEAHYGGNPVNVAVYLARLGRSASYIGAVGTDVYGGGMLAAIASRGVDVSHVQVCEGKTAMTHVEVVRGERILGDYDEGVMAHFTLRVEDMPFILSHEAAVTGLWGRCEGYLEQIRAAGVLTVFDCADRPEDEAARRGIPFSDIVFFSDDTSPDSALKKRMEQIYALKGHGIIAATRGAAGSLAFDGREYVSFGIVPCEVVDTMGAGDSYIAGFLDACLRGRALRECMEAGAGCSAVTLGYAGAF